MAFVVSRQRKIFYDLDGERGPYLLLYPSLWMDLKSWEEAGYLDVLQQEYRVLRMDPLGQGRSDDSDDISDYLPAARLQDLCCLLTALELDNVHFLGIGEGARIGYLLSAWEPNRLRSMAVLDGHPYVPEEYEKKTWQQHVDWVKSEDWEKLRQEPSLKELSDLQWDRIQKVKSSNRIAALQAEMQWPGVDQELSPFPSAPGMLFTSTREPSFMKMREAGRNCAYWRYHIFPQLEYRKGLLDSEILLPAYLDFVRRQRWVPRSYEGGYL